MVMKYMWHKPLESTCRGAETKRAADELIMALSSQEGRLVTILRSYIEMVKTTMQIDLGKKLGTLGSSNEILSRGHRKQS